MQREQTRTHDVLDVRAMKRLVEIEDARELATLRLRRELAIDPAQARDDPLATIVRQRRRRVRRQPLEMPDDQNDLAPIILRERRDDEALILPASDRRDEPFLLQSMQCAPHRRSAQSQSLGHGALGDARTGREVAPHDEAAQLLIDARDGIGPRIGVGRGPLAAGERRGGGSARGTPRDRGRHAGQAKCAPIARAQPAHIRRRVAPALVDRIGHRGDRFGRPLWYARTRRTLSLARLPAAHQSRRPMPLDLDDRSRAPGSAGTDTVPTPRAIRASRIGRSLPPTTPPRASSCKARSGAASSTACRHR